MSNEELKEYIERARVQLPLTSEHPFDMIWIPVLNTGQALRASLLEAPAPIWGKPYHKVYFTKLKLGEVAVGWEFHELIPANS